MLQGNAVVPSTNPFSEEQLRRVPSQSAAKEPSGAGPTTMFENVPPPLPPRVHKPASLHGSFGSSQTWKVDPHSGFFQSGSAAPSCRATLQEQRNVPTGRQTFEFTVEGISESLWAAGDETTVADEIEEKLCRLGAARKEDSCKIKMNATRRQAEGSVATTKNSMFSL